VFRVDLRWAAAISFHLLPPFLPDDSGTHENVILNRYPGGQGANRVLTAPVVVVRHDQDVDAGPGLGVATGLEPNSLVPGLQGIPFWLRLRIVVE